MLIGYIYYYIVHWTLSESRLLISCVSNETRLQHLRHYFISVATTHREQFPLGVAPDGFLILTFRNIKTEDDMDKVLNRLDAMESKFEARLDAMDSKFDAKFDALDSKIDNTRWFILGTIALVGLLVKLISI